MSLLEGTARWAAALIVVAGAAMTGRAQTCDGLAARWAFNGDGADSSGNGHNVQLFGGSFAPGVEGAAFQLVGGSFAQSPDAPGLNPTSAITVCGWYFPVSFAGTGNDPIVDKGYYGHSWPYYQYHLGVTGNLYGVSPASFGFGCTIAGGFAGVSTPAGVWTPGRWYHVAGTYDGAQMRIYVNGELRGANPVTGPISGYATAVSIGKFDNLPYTLPGAVDEVRIYSRALSATEIRLLATRPAGEPLAEPAIANTCPNGGAAEFTAITVGSGPFLYQWQWQPSAGGEWVDAIEGLNSDPLTGGPAFTATGSRSIGLGVTAVGATFSVPGGRAFRAVVTSGGGGSECGGGTTNPATLITSAACNAADIVGIGGGTAPGGLACPDGLLTGDDFNTFIAAFANEDLLADIVGIGGEPPADGLITGDDFNAFIGAFATGCP